MPTLLDKVWDLHTVRRLPTGQTQIFIGLHLIHEVTTPQAFAMLRERGLRPAFPERIFGTMDHIIPTASLRRPTADPVAEAMIAALEDNCREHHIPLYGLGDAHQGIVHVIGPEMGLTQPGMTIACGDSHTSTHGAFGALAFGIGTSQVRDVLGSQCLAMDKPKLRRVRFEGRMGPGVTAKDLALAMIRQLGVNGGVGFAYEYTGDAVDGMTMDERMTLCNLSIEGGARMGYVNPDDTTFAFLRGRAHAPAGDAWERAVAWWRSLASDAGSSADDERVIDVEPDCAGRHLGHESRSERCRGRTDPRSRRPAAGRARRGARGPAVHGLRSRRIGAGPPRGRGVHRLVHQRPLVRSAGRRRRGARTARGAPRARRWSSPDRAKCSRPRNAKGCTRCSSRPVSSGASPGARSAWA